MTSDEELLALVVSQQKTIAQLVQVIERLTNDGDDESPTVGQYLNQRG